ncbi:MAG: hypothetical protein ACFCBW_04725 [Candidatus Competibacterales bacterium]
MNEALWLIDANCVEDALLAKGKLVGPWRRRLQEPAAHWRFVLFTVEPGAAPSALWTRVDRLGVDRLSWRVVAQEDVVAIIHQALGQHGCRVEETTLVSDDPKLLAQAHTLGLRSLATGPIAAAV